MRCEQAREAIALARYSGGGIAPALRGGAMSFGDDPELQAHLAECTACRAVKAHESALDRWLALDEPAQAGPGFDTRFFARLAEEKARARRRRALRFAWLLVPAAAAAAATVLWLQRPPPAPTVPPPEELALAMDLELVEEMEVVTQLDDLEAYEVLSQLDEDELERILAEEPR